MNAPEEIQKNDDKTMRIRWEGGETTLIPFTELRFQCRCAECVDEWTRVRRVTREKIRPDVHPKAVEPVGRYAIQITWSDGHRAGIYPYDLLYAIAKGTADQGEHETVKLH